MIVINIKLPLGLILIFNVDMKQRGAILMAQQGFIVNIPHMKKGLARNSVYALLCIKTYSYGQAVPGPVKSSC